MTATMAWRSITNAPKAQLVGPKPPSGTIVTRQAITLARGGLSVEERMNYWWVNQTDNWRDELKSGYLYAGKSPHAYRKSILDVRKNDVVICSHGTGESRRIYAIAVVASDPSGDIVPRRETRNAPSANKQAWPVGWEAKADFVELVRSVLWAPIRRLIKGRFVAKHFTDGSNGVQGYLFPLPPDTAGEILRLVNRQQPQEVQLPEGDAIPSAVFASTVAAVVMVRLGHQKWAVEVKHMWGGRCCVTGFKVGRLLRASHIVAWSDDVGCRLDRYNGLCLSPAYDAAFDAYLITFLDDGSVVLASELSTAAARQIGIDPERRIIGLSPEHLKYLRRHRRAFKSKSARS
jgi:putative restriction endonuclease